MTITERSPAIAVIIPHYNDVDRLERCLNALMKNDIRDAEILVVDNGIIVEDGSHDELISAGGRYAGLWAAAAEQVVTS